MTIAAAQNDHKEPYRMRASVSKEINRAAQKGNLLNGLFILGSAAALWAWLRPSSLITSTCMVIGGYCLRKLDHYKLGRLTYDIVHTTANWILRPRRQLQQRLACQPEIFKSAFKRFQSTPFYPLFKKVLVRGNILASDSEDEIFRFIQQRVEGGCCFAFSDYVQKKLEENPNISNDELMGGINPQELYFKQIIYIFQGILPHVKLNSFDVHFEEDKGNIIYALRKTFPQDQSMAGSADFSFSGDIHAIEAGLNQLKDKLDISSDDIFCGKISISNLDETPVQRADSSEFVTSLSGHQFSFQIGPKKCRIIDANSDIFEFSDDGLGFIERISKLCFDCVNTKDHF